jgi:phosphoserine phosphatase
MAMPSTTSPHFLVMTSMAGVGAEAVASVEDRMCAVGLSVSEPRRLARTAVEIAFEGELPFGTRVSDFGAGRPLDINIVKSDTPRRLFIADMDSTMISVECIDELAAYAGAKDRVSAITERAMSGELNFEQALTERVALLRGLSEADLEACYRQRVRFNAGALRLVETMKSRGVVTALVSGGFTYFSKRVAKAAGFQIHRANVLVIAEGKLTGEVARPILGRSAKVDMLRSICAEHGFSAEQVVAVGDGANDISMIEAAGLGVAYRAKATLKESADACLDVSDLTAILALQGIPEKEWRT